MELTQSAVHSIEYLPPEDTYDITIAKNHNYLAASTGSLVLAHNCLHFIIRDLVGPIVHRTKAKPMKIKVDVIQSGFSSTKNYRGRAGFSYSVRLLAQDEDRNRKIVSIALKDIAAGHSVLIPIYRQEHADELVKMINERAGKKIATKFTGAVHKKEREKVLENARAGKWKCIVAMRSMLTGVDVPRWSSILEVMPINNAPNLEQELLRVCTPMPGKQQPVVRWMVDDFGISRGCFSASVSHMKTLRKRLGGFIYTERGVKNMKVQLATHRSKHAQKYGSWEDKDVNSKPFRAKLGAKKKEPKKGRRTYGGWTDQRKSNSGFRGTFIKF